MQATDDELIALLARCTLKDQQALKLLYDRLSPFLNGVAYRIVLSSELSNEVLQEAFVQIWQNAESYRPQQSKPLTWITSIVRYRAIDKLQVEQKHANRAAYDEEASALDNLESMHSPESDYAQVQLQGQIQDCLTQMNDKVKQCLELAYLIGYSREELAEHFDTNVNTVKSWLRRGSERLRLCLTTQQ